ncbi:MAG TPA: NAD-dependent protein deacetylase [Actinomycetales bacterium]|nr:NAD-dependent protein deacetylase [Actinomycetales bacterium]
MVAVVAAVEDVGALPALAGLVSGGGVVVLSGAGISTESGIPDYRGPTGARRRVAPMTYSEFTADPASRRRYWARSHLGWRHIARASPNAGHRAVAALQAAGLLSGLVTQNVDGLHQAGGAAGVVELHGNLERVVCLRCGDVSSREWLDQRLREANPGFDADVRRVNPDGDADLPDAAVSGFRIVACAVCGTGALKPDVVFFGENVPRDRVARCFDLVDAARALLVLGSSLTVMSGYRFVRHAATHGKPVAIVNSGPTRGDDQATLRIDAALGTALPALLSHLPS